VNTTLSDALICAALFALVLTVSIGSIALTSRFLEGKIR
jgi:hypothetical protein